MVLNGGAPVRRAGGFVLLSLLVVPAVALIGCGRAQAPADSGPARAQPKVLADYDFEIRERQPRADGVRHVDTPATIARLREAHVTTYFYLIFHAATDWADFTREFLPAAEQAGIDVWVYLVPPSECCSQPFGTDFVRWTEEIAHLSLRHPSIRGWAMDDFASNLTTFTPEYTKAMRDAARGINRELRFLPVLYHDDYSPEFLAAYASHFDGVIFPFTVSFETGDGLDDVLERITRRLDPFGLDLLLMIYATKMSVAPYPPSAEYVAGSLRVGLEWMMRGRILGVTTYGLPKALEEEACSFAHHLSLTVPSETPTSAGDFAAASQMIRLEPGADAYLLRFSEQDSYPIGTAGYHFKQLLVDDWTVWDQDVASDADLAWVERTFDLSRYVKGKSVVTITFRLYDKKGVTNFGIRASIAGLEGTGFRVENPGFTSQTGWSFSTRGPGSARYGYHACDPQRQRHVFEAVGDLYGAASRQ